MRKTLMMAAVAALVLTTGAHAWTTDPTTPSNTARARAAGFGGMGGAGGAGGAATSTATGGTGSGGSSVSGGNNLSVSGGSAIGISPPAFAGAGQCTPVGIGPTGVGSGGGGGGLITWESTNCRNYYIALALLALGRTDDGVRLLASITSEAHEAIYPAKTSTSPTPAPVVAPARKPDYCLGHLTAGERQRHPECS